MVREASANAAKDWMAVRAEDLLPVEYVHVVFTLPAEIARIAYFCTGPQFKDRKLALSGLGVDHGLLLPDGFGRAVAVAFDQPAFVVGPPEGEQSLAQLSDRLEPAHPEQGLLQGADEARGTAVSLGGPDEGRGALGVEEADLALEILARGLAAMIVADLEAFRDNEPMARQWSERHWRMPKAPKPRRTPWRTGSSASWRLAEALAWIPMPFAEQWGVAMSEASGRHLFETDAERGLAFTSDDGGHIGPPHRI